MFSGVITLLCNFIFQSVRVMEHATKRYQFSLPEVGLITALLSQHGLDDPNPPPSAVEELSAALSQSLYFDR